MAGQHVRAFVCGSKSNDGTRLADRYTEGVKPASSTLKTRKLDVALPRANEDASAASIGTHVYVFGGRYGSSYLNDFDSNHAGDSSSNGKRIHCS